MGKKSPPARPSNDKIREWMLQYFYEKNKHAKSIMGKKGGAAPTISIIRAELKAKHDLTVQEVTSNLTYLLSQGWVAEKPVEKSFPTRGGSIVPAVTPHYIITAAGIDKIEGPGEFTMDKFQGIRIEATGQNIITVGHGNQVNIQFREAAEALAELADTIKASSDLTESQKLEFVADIETIQAQLAKSTPNGTIIQTVWNGLQGIATLEGVAAAFTRASQFLTQWL